MGESTDLIKAGAEFALEQQKKREQRQKITDYQAVKLKILAMCFADTKEFLPPLKVLINGEYKTQEINGVSTDNSDNYVELWHQVPVRLKGADNLQIVLEPTDGAEKYFREGKSKKRNYSPAYTRNQEQSLGREFKIPPEKDIYEGHNVRINIAPKRRWWGPKLSSDAIHNQLPHAAKKVPLLPDK